MRGLIGFTLLPLLASSAPTFSTETIHEGAAPLLSASNAEQIPDSYIVVFKQHVDEATAADHHTWVQDLHVQRTELRKRSQFPFTSDIFDGIKHTYNIAGDFLGYSGHFDDSVIEAVRRHPDVSNTRSPSTCRFISAACMRQAAMTKIAVIWRYGSFISMLLKLSKIARKRQAST